MTAQPILVTSRANARVKQLRAAFAGHARLSGGLVAIEGDNLLREALASGVPLKTIFLSERVRRPRGFRAASNCCCSRRTSSTAR